MSDKIAKRVEARFIEAQRKLPKEGVRVDFNSWEYRGGIKRNCPVCGTRTTQFKLYVEPRTLSISDMGMVNDSYVPAWVCGNCSQAFPRQKRTSPKQKRMQDLLDDLLGE